MQANIISEAKEYPTIFTNWLGNNLANTYARYLPKIMEISIAGINGLSVNFL